MSDIATLVLAGGVRCQGVAIPPSGRQCFVFVAEAEWRAALVNTSAAIPLMSSASSSRPRLIASSDIAIRTQQQGRKGLFSCL